MTTAHEQHIDHQHAANALEAWFHTAARDLPWRRHTNPGQPPAENPDTPKRDKPRRDPWTALVSEIMLQQTQAARVAERFDTFINRFPTPEALAAATEDDVLALWAGLGYYRRARSLHAAAKAIVNSFQGRVPAEVDELLELPGVGRYTAGAVASIAFGKPAPIVDGNVTRVLTRLAARDTPPDDPDTVQWTWANAQALTQAAHDPGLANEALMELGATVCTPKTPRCLFCPLADRCQAHRQDRTADIPKPKRRAARKAIHLACVIAKDHAGRIALTRRNDTELWAGLWQPPTLQRQDRPWRLKEVAQHLDATTPVLRARFNHTLTHREAHFAVYTAAACTTPAHARLINPAQLHTLGVSAAHAKAIRLALDPPATGHDPKA